MQYIVKKGTNLLCFCLLFYCNGDNESTSNNPYLFDPDIDLQLNLNLPEYNSLNFPGNHIIVDYVGIGGIVVYNLDNTQFFAYDLSDPNHVPNDCSKMEISSIEATCPCPDDENIYNIVTGQHLTAPDSLYPMQQYRAFKEGNLIIVIN